jgi:threonine dehydrogenase-like Zn-dependent dehydrogenase
MTATTSRRQPELTRQTVVVIGGGGIGLQTARGTRSGGADIVLTGGNADRLERAPAGLGALSNSSLRRRRPGRARAVLRRPARSGRPCDGHGRRPGVR